MWCICVPQGDGNIRYYELSTEKPYINFLTEYRSLLPQKGIGECSYTTLTLTLFTKVDTISFDLWRYFRSDAKARPGRERLWGFPILPSDCHQRPGRTTVDDRSTEGGLFYILYSSSCCIYTRLKVRGTDLLCTSSQVFSKRICIRWQPETRQPWRLRSGCLGSTEVGDELRWMTDACISFSQWSTRLSVSVRPCAYVHEAWDSSSQPVPRNPCWEGACEAVELPEIRDGSSWWCRDQDRS